MSATTFDRAAYWRVRVHCWYEPHRNIGAKPKPNKCEIRSVIVGPCDMDEARTRSVEWAEKTAGIGNKWIGFEFMGSSKVTFPLDVTHKY